MHNQTIVGKKTQDWKFWNCYGGKLIEKKCVGGSLLCMFRTVIAVFLSEHILEVYNTKKFVFMALGNSN